jgi:hypothetical protein
MRKHGLTGELIPENEAERTHPAFIRQQRDNKEAAERRREDLLFGNRRGDLQSLKDMRDDSVDRETAAFNEAVVKAELQKRLQVDPAYQRNDLIDWLRSASE